MVSCDLTECELDQFEGDVAVGQMSAACYFDGIGGENEKSFRENFVKAFGPSRRISSIFAATYTAAALCIEAIHAIGDDEPRAVRQQLYSTTTQSAGTGAHRFRHEPCGIAVPSRPHQPQQGLRRDCITACHCGRSLSYGAAQCRATETAGGVMKHTPNFSHRRAVVLHRQDSNTDRLIRQLSLLGLVVDVAWEPLSAGNLPDIVLVDADQGWDGLLPWKSGEEAPCPVVALLGTEAPSRIAWALEQGAGAILTKPINPSAVFPALVLAHARHEERAATRERLAILKSGSSSGPLFMQPSSFSCRSAPSLRTRPTPCCGPQPCSNGRLWKRSRLPSQLEHSSCRRR